MKSSQNAMKANENIKTHRCRNRDEQRDKNAYQVRYIFANATFRDMPRIAFFLRLLKTGFTRRRNCPLGYLGQRQLRQGCPKCTEFLLMSTEDGDRE